jgi:hypothetical protein
MTGANPIHDVPVKFGTDQVQFATVMHFELADKVAPFIDAP